MPHPGSAGQGYENLYLPLGLLWLPFLLLYEGISVEKMRYNCGASMAKRDDASPDIVAGVPDSGTAHAIGYSNTSGIPFSGPLSNTPLYLAPVPSCPPYRARGNLIAKMKLIPVHLIQNRSMLLIDDSIVRGAAEEKQRNSCTKAAQKRYTSAFCLPPLYACKYLNFSRSTSEMDPITRRVIKEMEGDNKYVNLDAYSNLRPLNSRPWYPASESSSTSPPCATTV